MVGGRLGPAQELELELRLRLPVPEGLYPRLTSLVPPPGEPHLPVFPSSSQGPVPTAAGKVAEFSLDVRVCGVAPGPLRPIRIAAVVVIQSFVREPGVSNKPLGLGPASAGPPTRRKGSAHILFRLEGM